MCPGAVRECPLPVTKGRHGVRMMVMVMVMVMMMVMVIVNVMVMVMNFG
jgi:hypothetical protein